ncbi:NAD(P)-binding domain-containing protein [Sandaracinus amylolyticus]|uniref:Thioredoxin reductase n=1 Tax=Sandaracinus amylolyticus TaxID=927083 RepID=A0A0F6YJX7_9BACT|nr:NAD(P)-binding domain-containing protein [Sandaracinus amylolyticus]AKF06676.1 Thioredoxin reductase [Sandaracinus amylolyticus]
MPFARYARWLHTRWPAGGVERLPIVGEDGATDVPGLRIAGDLTGVPLLKLAIDSAVRAVRAFSRELDRDPQRDRAQLDLVIVGGGVAGIAAAIEARACGLRAEVIEASRAFDTVHELPARKPIFTYPTELRPEGAMQVAAGVRETLIDELEAQRIAHAIEPRAGRVTHVERDGAVLAVHLEEGAPVHARRVLIAIGRTGDPRRLGVPGEDLEHVHHRLYDPADHRGERVLVVGGGDSACETALALAREGAKVTMVHRGADLARAKHENAEAVRAERAIDLRLGTRVRAIEPTRVHLEDGTSPEIDRVFAMLGREAPLELLRRSRVRIAREWSPRAIVSMIAFLALCTFVYTWKSGGALTRTFQDRGWFPFGIGDALAPAAGSALHTITISLEEPGFWYSTAYSAAVLGFGIARIRRRRTPYVTKQTITLTLVQLIPLFVLPYFVLPLLGRAGVFDAGAMAALADGLFPRVEYGHGREYWRAFGLVLAWPLFIWNVFTERPMWLWLGISLVQTFVIIPLIVRRWGKGAYCGWICSCGALAETLGDAHREKMPHGPFWNRLNMLGQVVLGAVFVLLFLRVVSWIQPRSWPGYLFGRWFRAGLSNLSMLWIPLDYYHVVDILFAGILGVGLYFWMSGRTWCRFACPLAALMHVYQRAFGLFRIFADKKKCISCNRCTSACHQGIDVMAFAQRGAPMEDPQCVRCSACVQTCPTGVLTFGRYDGAKNIVLDGTLASPVHMREDGKRGLAVVR